MTLLLVACLVPEPEPESLVLDAQGLPECAASYNETQMCTALSRWVSSEPADFNAGGTGNQPIRWIGTSEQPAYCTDDPAEAEAYVLALSPDADGTHATWPGAGWWDIRRYDAGGTYVGADRVMRCDLVATQAATPPGVDTVEPLLQLSGALAVDDFFPMAREMSRWRRSILDVSVVLTWGEAQSEAAVLGVCSLRCGECGDVIGPVRNYTAVLESQRWSYDPESGRIDFDVDAVHETDCQAKF